MFRPDETDVDQSVGDGSGIGIRINGLQTHHFRVERSVKSDTSGDVVLLEDGIVVIDVLDGDFDLNLAHILRIVLFAQF